MYSLKGLTIVALIAYFQYSLSFQCGKYDSNKGATFNLEELIRSSDQPAYTVEDGDIPCTTKIEQNYTYVFNVCGLVSNGLPKNCDSVLEINSGGAIQIDRRGSETTGDDYCYLVGKYSEESTKLSLLNPEDPTAGIQMSYYGSYCNNGIQRQFNIQMPCANRLSPVPTHAQELSPCVYTIQMPSVYGCPLECGIANRQLCGGNGHCAYDGDKVAAKCFCNNGYTGNDCSQKTSSQSLNYSPALLGLIITLFIIIVGLGGSIVYMVRQISAYKEDMANYAALQSNAMGDEQAVV